MDTGNQNMADAECFLHSTALIRTEVDHTHPFPDPRYNLGPDASKNLFDFNITSSLNPTWSTEAMKQETVKSRLPSSATLTGFRPFAETSLIPLHFIRILFTGTKTSRFSISPLIPSCLQLYSWRQRYSIVYSFICVEK